MKFLCLTTNASLPSTSRTAACQLIWKFVYFKVYKTDPHWVSLVLIRYGCGGVWYQHSCIWHEHYSCGRSLICWNVRSFSPGFTLTHVNGLLQAFVLIKLLYPQSIWHSVPIGREGEKSSLWRSSQDIGWNGLLSIRKVQREKVVMGARFSSPTTQFELMLFIQYLIVCCFSVKSDLCGLTTRTRNVGSCRWWWERKASA